jgi:oligosaccharide repeat unit polymerase
MRNRIALALFLAFYGYYLIGGILTYKLANYFSFAHYDFDYQIDLFRASLYALAALGAFVLAYATLSQIRLRKPLAPHPRESQGELRVETVHVVACLAVFVIGLLGAFLMFREYGWRIPSLTSGSDEWRTQISSGLPQILYFHLVGAVLIAYSLRGAATKSLHRLLFMGVMILSLFIIYLGASRSMLVTPILVILIDQWCRQKLKTIWLFTGTLAAGLVVFITGLLRMGTDGEQAIYLLRFVADVAPELREFAKLLDYIPDRADFLHGQMFVNGVVIMVPGKLIALLGGAKELLWQPFGEYLKNLYGYAFAGGGLRAGLIAEYYANFGLFGIILGFYAMGLLVRFVDVKIMYVRGTTRLFFLVLALSLATSTLFTFDGVVYKLVAFSAAWIVYSLVALAARVSTAPQPTGVA